jgi:predicted amino acid-binding ACT domain protein
MSSDEGGAFSMPELHVPDAQLLRLALPDRPGALALVASRLAAHGVNILRVEVVDSRVGTATDDLLVEGGDLEAALEELAPEVRLLGVRAHAELPDPGLAMAAALTAVSGAATLGSARRALLSAALGLVRADAGVVLRDAGHGWLRPVAATVESLPPIRDDQPSLARTALVSCAPAVADANEAWAPQPYLASLGSGGVLVVPGGLPAFLVLAVVRRDAFPFVEAEIERLRALLRVSVGILHALGERYVGAPDSVPLRVLEGRR